MTIEEAIGHFELLSDSVDGNAISFEWEYPNWKSKSRKYKELFDMAINALRAQKNPSAVKFSVNDLAD